MNIDRLFINDIDIQEEYGFWLKWRELSAPSAKTNYISIPGRDGDLDLTEAMGDVFYSNREIQINMVHPSDSWYDDYGRFVSDFHGRQCRILFNNDPDWYWTGRINVTGYSAKDHSLSMTAIVNPYKLASTESTQAVTVSGLTEENAQRVTLVNDRMKVTPQVTVSSGGEIHLKWGDRTAVLSEGTMYVSGLTLGEGENSVDVWGTGTVTFRYRMGML